MKDKDEREEGEDGSDEDGKDRAQAKDGQVGDKGQDHSGGKSDNKKGHEERAGKQDSGRDDRERDNRSGRDDRGRDDRSGDDRRGDRDGPVGLSKGERDGGRGAKDGRNERDLGRDAGRFGGSQRGAGPPNRMDRPNDRPFPPRGEGRFDGRQGGPLSGGRSEGYREPWSNSNRGFQRGRPGLDRMGGLGMSNEMRMDAVDREKVCPMLVRIFCKFNEFHNDEEFSYMAQPLDAEVRVHTWRDATLGEITELLAQVHREVRQGGTRCSFKVVYPDNSGKFVSSILGSTSMGKRTQDDVSRKTLEQLRFRTGDFISVAIYPAKSGYNRAKESEGQDKRDEEEPERESRGGRESREEEQEATES